MNTYGLNEKIPRGNFPGYFFIGKQTQLWEEKYFLSFDKTIYVQTNKIDSG